MCDLVARPAGELAGQAALVATWFAVPFVERQVCGFLGVAPTGVCHATTACGRLCRRPTRGQLCHVHERVLQQTQTFQDLLSKYASLLRYRLRTIAERQEWEQDIREWARRTSRFRADLSALRRHRLLPDEFLCLYEEDEAGDDVIDRLLHAGRLQSQLRWWRDEYGDWGHDGGCDGSCYDDAQAELNHQLWTTYARELTGEAREQADEEANEEYVRLCAEKGLAVEGGVEE